jgi:hypothetical protein
MLRRWNAKAVKRSSAASQVTDDGVVEEGGNCVLEKLPLLRPARGLQERLGAAALHDLRNRPRETAKTGEDAAFVESVFEGAEARPAETAQAARFPEVSRRIAEVGANVTVIGVEVFVPGAHAKELEERLVRREMAKGRDPKAGERHVGLVEVHREDPFGLPREIIEDVAACRRDGKDATRVTEAERLGVHSWILPNLGVDEPPKPERKETIHDCLARDLSVAEDGALETRGGRTDHEAPSRVTEKLLTASKVGATCCSKIMLGLRLHQAFTVLSRA